MKRLNVPETSGKIVALYHVLPEFYLIVMIGSLIMLTIFQMCAENRAPRDDPSYLLVFCEPLLVNGFQPFRLTKQKTVVGFESGRVY